MKRLFYLLSFSLIFILGCSSKKAKIDSPDQSAIGDHTNDPLSFDPDGSDSQKIPGLTTVHFAFDKATLDTVAKASLQKNVDWLREHKSNKLKIEGHCDLKGSTEYNLALGDQRARAAKSYMVQLGISEDRLDTVSFGKEKPLTTDESESAQAKNRRDNFVPTQ